MPQTNFNLRVVVDKARFGNVQVAWEEWVETEYVKPRFKKLHMQDIFAITLTRGPISNVIGNKLVWYWSYRSHMG